MMHAPPRLSIGAVAGIGSVESSPGPSVDFHVASRGVPVALASFTPSERYNLLQGEHDVRPIHDHRAHGSNWR